MLPIDVILVRHGQSELNKASKASRKGDNHFFTPEFRNTHSRNFRLTDLGIRQAKVAGEWLKKNIQPFDRFYVSDYIRAKETAGYLDLPQVEWGSEFSLRERDTALMDNCPDDEKKRLFELETRQHEIDPFLSYPAGGGESIAALCHRLKTDFVSHLARECSNKRVIAVCHGHVMRALQLIFENIGHDEFIRLDSSENPEDKIRNCQIIWYTRRYPADGKVSDRLTAVRSICPLVCPTDTKEDWGWRFIQRRRYSNQELLEEIGRYPRHII
ncbi:MAG: histidine phosphatase family protein [Candidatus Yanofskybacteria bacterium]|nr:histidine phosphatase family protein [Candidatus Yanofskybacteria bacterium]